MKRFRLLSLSLVMAIMFGADYACAQTSGNVDNTFCFIDADGNEVKDGSTVIFNAVEEEKVPGVPFFGVTAEAKFELSVKNTTDGTPTVAARITTIKKSSGKVQFCFPNQCQSGDLPLSYSSDCSQMLAGEIKGLNTEWLPEVGTYGEADFQIQLLSVESLDITDKFKYTVKGYGPTINIHCIYADPSGINDLTADENVTETVRYDALGRKLSAPKKGINIVKLSNGKTVKKMIK